MRRSRPKSSNAPKQTPCRGRSVGAVVRSVPNARPDHRAGGRRHRGPGRAGQGQRRREPCDLAGLPGAEHPGRVRAERRQGRRPVHRRAARAGGEGVRRAVCSPASRRTKWPNCSPKGDEASLRQVLELEADNEPAIVALGEMLVGATAEGEEALQLIAAHPRDRPSTRRVAALARAGDVGTTDIEQTPRRATRSGQRRRRRPPGVPRPARAARPRRSPHGWLPQAAHRSSVLGSAVLGTAVLGTARPAGRVRKIGRSAGP